MLLAGSMIKDMIPSQISLYVKTARHCQVSIFIGNH